jgi:predicted DNA-binding transcriptional regulator AlpA
MDVAAVARRYNMVLPIEATPEHLLKLDRLVSIRLFGEITGWSRQTILRAEAAGNIPRRRKLPNGQAVFLASEVQAWIEALPVAPLPKG